MAPTFEMNVHYFGQARTIFFEEQFPFWDLYLCKVAQVFVPDLDENILGNQIYLWTDEDNQQVVMNDADEFVYAL